MRPSAPSGGAYSGLVNWPPQILTKRRQIEAVDWSVVIAPPERSDIRRIAVGDKQFAMVRDHQQTASAALPQFAHDRRAQEVVAWREAEIKEHLGQRSAGRVKAGSEDKDLDPVPEIFPQIANGST